MLKNEFVVWNKEVFGWLDPNIEKVASDFNSWDDIAAEGNRLMDSVKTEEERIVCFLLRKVTAKRKLNKVKL